MLLLHPFKLKSRECQPGMKPGGNLKLSIPEWGYPAENKRGRLSASVVQGATLYRVSGFRLCWGHTVLGLGCPGVRLPWDQAVLEAGALRPGCPGVRCPGVRLSLGTDCPGVQAIEGVKW